MAAATPTGRERYVDFLRVFSLAVVMLGHWLMAVVEWRDGRLHIDNVLETTPAARWLTWIFQIMPVFFIVGGFSNAASLAAARRDGKAYGDWLRGRLTRLVRPVLAFALVWTAFVTVLRLLGADPAAVRAGSLAQPLWFLAVYIGVVALAPALVRAQARWGAAVPVALGLSVAAVDVARWVFGVPLIGWVNFSLVWLFAHQLGVMWRKGDVRVMVTGTGGRRGRHRPGRTGRAHPGTGLLGLHGGRCQQARSNTFPPSLALVFLAAWQFGAVLAVRPLGLVDRWLARPRVWTGVVTANGMAMTLFLWHITAMALVAVVVLPTGLLPAPGRRHKCMVGHATGVDRDCRRSPWSRWWWLSSGSRQSGPDRATVSAARAGVAAVILMVGMAVLARKGFAAPGVMPIHVVATTLLGAGWWMLSGDGRPPPAGGDRCGRLRHPAARRPQPRDRTAVAVDVRPGLPHRCRRRGGTGGGGPV